LTREEFESYFQIYKMSRLAVLALVVASCSSSAPPRATAADAARANVALAELERGRAVLVTKCGNCHQVPRPRDDWRSSMTEMAARANLDDDQQRVVVQYLTVMAYEPTP
jgi:uncharacterized membrane protein